VGTRGKFLTESRSDTGTAIRLNQSFVDIAWKCRAIASRKTERLALPSKRRCLIAFTCVFAGRCMASMRCPAHPFQTLASERIAMTILSVRPGSSRIRLRKPHLKFASKFLWKSLALCGACALMRALHESRMRTATKVFREYAHLNAANQSVTGRRSTPQQ
jgi:hypothetical protein